MEIVYYLASFCLIAFMVLATYDGFYLHIWKYGLFNREESFFEHKMHTLRAILFPLIVWLLFINETSFMAFIIGISLVAIDMIVLAVDAYSEKESRSFMGGLPQWEYIVHLFANAFHFTTIILVLALKINVTTATIEFASLTIVTPAQEIFHFISVNIIPGAIILALTHVLLLVPKPRTIWNTYRTKLSCC